ncbi:hypothetical protein F5Y10DRAFT_272976 [Nemania abortiva]|nr:hypothetical protein F5Y10DRAFT_272976 [Nemania abortiva]
MEKFNHPEIVAQLKATPGWSPNQLVPECRECHWTYFYKHFTPGQAHIAKPKCLQCSGRTNEDIWPCCWGKTHQYRPYQVPWTDFAPTPMNPQSQKYCSACRGLPPLTIPKLGLLPQDEKTPASARMRQQGDQPQLAPATSHDPRFQGPSNRASSSSPFVARIIAGVPSEPVWPDEACRKQFNMLLPLRSAAVRSPQYEKYYKDLLTEWLFFLCKQGTKPKRCVNCLAEAQDGSDNAFCKQCRQGEKWCNWANFGMCISCMRIRPLERFNAKMTQNRLLCLGCWIGQQEAAEIQGGSVQQTSAQPHLPGPQH